MPNNMQSKLNAAALIFIWKNGPCTIDESNPNSNKAKPLLLEGLIQEERTGFVVTPKGAEAVMQILDELDKIPTYINFQIRIKTP